LVFTDVFIYYTLRAPITLPSSILPGINNPQHQTTPNFLISSHLTTTMAATTTNPGPGKHLFTIPIPPLGPHPGGAIVATEPRPKVYLLTFTSPPDNRLTTASCDALLDALDMIEFGGYEPGVVVTTSGIPKFYSNGLDLEHAISTEGFMDGKLYRVFLRFLT
jgi:hypothetical protein